VKYIFLGSREQGAGSREQVKGKRQEARGKRQEGKNPMYLIKLKTAILIKFVGCFRDGGAMIVVLG